MDLFAYVSQERLEHLLPGETPPRPRGMRLMALERKEYYSEEEYNDLPTVYREYMGKDVLYVYTRCGDCGLGEDGNYQNFGMDEWENELDGLLLNSVDNDFDCTYRETYIKVPEDKMELYKTILKELDEELREGLEMDIKGIENE